MINMTYLIFTLSIILTTVFAQRSADLRKLINSNVQTSMSGVVPAGESSLVSDYTTNIGYYARDGLTAASLDDFIDGANFNSNLKAIAKEKLDAIKYADQEVILLQNTTYNPSTLQLGYDLLFIAASNVNNSISVSYYYGTSDANCIQQTYWIDCCDDTCSIGACRTVISIGCSGCNGNRAFTSQELFNIGVGVSVQVRNTILNPQVKALTNSYDVILKNINGYGGTFDEMYHKLSTPVTKISNIKTSVPFNKKYRSYQKQWFGTDYSPPVWSEVTDGIIMKSNMLKNNISQLANDTSISKECAVNTCLKFSYYQYFVDVGKFECVKKEYINDFIDVTFQDVLDSADDPNVIREDLAQFKFASNVSWTMTNFDFASTTMTKPGFASVWKTFDKDADCYHWLISSVYGKIKIAPDILKETESDKYFFGMMGGDYTKYYFEPHPISPQDVMYMGDFFQAIIVNAESQVMGLNASITYFPSIDC